MGTFYASITDGQADLIRCASLFFVATADPALLPGPDQAGPINLSPKGGVRLHVVDRNRVAYLDYAGSANETARHSAAGGPITVMVCSFEAGNSAIIRLFGRASVVPVADSPLAPALLAGGPEDLTGPPRQVIDIAVERTMTSCGFGVPVMAFVRERTKADRGRRYRG